MGLKSMLKTYCISHKRATVHDDTKKYKYSLHVSMYCVWEKEGSINMSINKNPERLKGMPPSSLAQPMVPCGFCGERVSAILVTAQTIGGLGLGATGISGVLAAPMTPQFIEEQQPF
jgi:hypothetical protein